MHFSTSYRPITLDSICNSAFFFSGLWQPQLKRNQSPYLLRLIINKLYGASHGSLFHARIRASHASLAVDLDLSRPWTCHLIAVLREAGWLETSAPRLPDGKQEITIFRPGKMLKRVLVMLIKSREKRRVNNQRQESPTKADVEKNLQFLRQLQQDLALKMKMKT
jgi:hypothetical protein